MAMGDYKIKKGFDIKLKGKPSIELVEIAQTKSVAVYPLEFKGFKQRLKVKEGDTVKRGSELMENKRHEKFKLRAPASGKVASIVRGHRRFVEKIIIEVDDNDQVEEFSKYSSDEIASLDRSKIIDQLIDTGYLAYIMQRPFCGIVDETAEPKNIFVNAMNTGPFQADAGVVANDDAEAFQAGLDLMNRLTAGSVHLCVAKDERSKFESFSNVELHTFTGKHPAGNTSVHISRVAPMKPTDIVWTVNAVDLSLIGRLFLDGALPKTKIVSVGGAGIKEEGRKHYKVSIGADLKELLAGKIEEGEQRLITGDVLSGERIEADGYVRFYQSSLTVIPEGRNRRFLGWTMPGFNLFSFSRLVGSTWFGGHGREWNLDTNSNGELRAMVLSGHYDKVMPMNIMVDYLVRAVLAGDTDEAISLGILETAPEDFALCDFICPCKMNIQEIISNGLDMIEEEGL